MPALSRRAPQGTPKRLALQARVSAAAEQLLAEGRPYVDITVEQIAARAGISRTTFYDYFPDKRELLLAMGAKVTEELLSRTRELGARAEDDDVDLRAALAVVVGVWRDHGVVLRAFTEASTYVEKIGAAWGSHMDFLIDTVRGRLEDRRTPGRANEPVAAIASALVWMTQQTCYQEIHLRSLFSADEVLEALERLWRRGLGLNES
jgi:AcrR family transcriptional regulator